MEPVLVSALKHWSYCPRQCGLIHIESVWDENLFTMRGKIAHERADTPVARQERGHRVERALPIWSDKLGLQGRADVVEFGPDGTPMPVEYKSGPEIRHRHAEIQLCGQALCLEEMFSREVPEGAIYFVASRKRVPIKLDQALRAQTVWIIAQIRENIASGALSPAVYDKRCRQCSLIDACLPQMLGSVGGVGDWSKPLKERDLP